jgi:hypothetical protein
LSSVKTVPSGCLHTEVCVAIPSPHTFEHVPTVVIHSGIHGFVLHNVLIVPVTTGFVLNVAQYESSILEATGQFSPHEAGKHPNVGVTKTNKTNNNNNINNQI